jgi:predicted nucleic acid-binding protein
MYSVVKNSTAIQYLSVKLKKINYVGWVKERNPTFTRVLWVSLCSTQPTKILNRAVLDRYLSREIREDFLASLATETELITINETIDICRDPKDNKFLELAISGNATHIITGDKDLLELHPFQDILIVTPSQFLDSISSN